MMIMICADATHCIYAIYEYTSTHFKYFICINSFALKNYFLFQQINVASKNMQQEELPGCEKQSITPKRLAVFRVAKTPFIA